MAKEKVTLTLDADRMAELRALIGARSLSATVDRAVAAYLEQARHQAAVDTWLLELEQAHGPVSGEAHEWAASTVAEWESTDHRTQAPRRG